MNFNMDLVVDELADLHPTSSRARGAALRLDRIEVFEADSAPRAESLFIIDADAFAHLDEGFLQGGSFLVRGSPTEGPPSPGLADAVFVDAKTARYELLTRLLEFRLRLDTWSNDVLGAMARDAALQEVFDVVARAFRNPLMLSDSSLYFVLCAGSFPEDFSDPLWTPAIETGVCPSELYCEAWKRSAQDAFGQREAYMVKPLKEGGHAYLVRNLICGGATHGCIELVSANAPFTAGDLALVDYVGDLLTMILPRRPYTQIAHASLGPVGDLLAGQAVRKHVLVYGLAKIGWKIDDAYYLVCFSGVEDDEDAARSQTARRIADLYPQALFYEEGPAHLMVARDADYPLADIRARQERRGGGEPGPQRFCAGFSSLFSDFTLVRTAAEQARFAFGALEDLGQGGSFGITRSCFYDECWFEDLRGRLGLDDDAAWLLDRAALALFRADAADGTAYLDTVLAYLAHGCSAARAAEALYLHRNTLAYRLKRIKAIAGIDLENPASRNTDLLRVFLSCKALASPSARPAKPSAGGVRPRPRPKA